MSLMLTPIYQAVGTEPGGGRPVGQADSEPVVWVRSFSACVPLGRPQGSPRSAASGKSARCLRTSDAGNLESLWNPQALPLALPESRALALCTCLPTPSGKYYLFSPLRAGLAHRAMWK